jgi:hypothetical protein
MERLEPLDPSVIVRIALMQIVALVYNLLACGTVIKMDRSIFDQLNHSEVYTQLPAYQFMEYGWLFFFVILTWAGFAWYYSLLNPERKIAPELLLGTGFFLFVFLFMVPAHWDYDAWSLIWI